MLLPLRASGLQRVRPASPRLSSPEAPGGVTEAAPERRVSGEWATGGVSAARSGRGALDAGRGWRRGLVSSLSAILWLRDPQIKAIAGAAAGGARGGAGGGTASACVTGGARAASGWEGRCGRSGNGLEGLRGREARRGRPGSGETALRARRAAGPAIAQASR